ncbi:EAL domain-containing protein [Clostridium gasigenes]|uniref:putative bifunctional diguanylate cyclase/phosphodiesterase n=1 Tax=Clostridium gasigenes TaxID=94869 RepID=UPI001C0D69CA|nr:EAL domain-containing protein [Clostridium gasigenes]MBU3131182.1 EAL domain-containing protein [Clostridium gasigenes]
MKNCDIAMYRAKETGYNKYKFYNKDMSLELMKKLNLELMLKNAVYNKEFELYYQPQIDIKNNNLVGAEALIRWNTPDGKMVFPNEFIPIAEEIGVVVPLGQWVLENALKQIKVWNEKYGLELSVGINISPKQFDSLNFVDNVKSTINRLGVSTKWIDIEITEACAMNNEMETDKKIMEFNNFGVEISIDDFGTGYSSFGYLKRFPVDKLKIDKHLIDKIEVEHNEFHIVKAIIVMSKALGVKVIAEGVETKEQLEKLKELECDQVQGYYYSKPIKAVDFEKYIEESISNKMNNSEKTSSKEYINF